MRRESRDARLASRSTTRESAAAAGMRNVRPPDNQEDARHRVTRTREQQTMRPHE